MRRRGFFAFAAGIMVVAGCGSTRTSGASTANRLSIIAPMAHGAESLDLAVRTLATVLVDAKLARTVGVSNHPGGLDAATMSTFSAAHGSFMSDGQLLLTGMPMVAGAEITNAAAVVDSTTPIARLIGDWAALVVPRTPTCAPSTTSWRCSAAIRPGWWWAVSPRAVPTTCSTE